MLKSLTLRNYQSHKDTTLEFSPGVNVIVGSSRSGKTATLRALNWVLYNKPAGLAMCSYWNRTAKKLPKNPFSAMVEFDNISITRERGELFNGYKTSVGLEYEALGQTVPDDISSTFNLSEVNMQYQFSQPFLISESAAEIARFFNKTIKLDKIDSVLSSAEKKRREANKNIKDGKEALGSLQKEDEELAWIDAVEPLIVLAERSEKRLNDKRISRGTLFNFWVEIAGLQALVDSAPNNLDELLQKMQQSEDFDKKIEEKSVKEDNLKEIVENIRATSDIISSVPDTELLVKKMDCITTFDSEIEIKIDRETALKELISTINLQGKLLNIIVADDALMYALSCMVKAETFDRYLENKISLITPLESLINGIKSAEDQIKTQARAIVVYENQMPTTCPTCGKPLEGDSCGRD